MAVIGFTQDPQAPEGAGMFHLDDGRSIFAHDPDMARTLTSEQREARYGPDMRIAGPMMAAAPAPEAMPAPQEKAPQTRQGVTTVEHVEPEQPPATPTPEQEFDQGMTAAMQRRARQAAAPRKEGYIPKTRAETVETEGVPYNPEDAADRIQANRAVMEARAATAEMQRQRAMEEIAIQKARQPELQHRAAEAQKQLDAQHAAYQRERSDLDRAIEQSNASQGGASQWFASKGTVAQLGMVLGQAFGAYAATLGGGQNWAQQQINTMMEHDIAAQKEQAKRGVDNAYRRLELRYKDSDQAEAALRIAQGNVLQNVMAMHASANQAQDVQAAFQQMAAENQEKLVAHEQQMQNAAYGKHTVKTDLAHQVRGGGGYDPVPEAQRLIKAGMEPEKAWQYAVTGHGNGKAWASQKTQEEARDLVKTEKEDVAAQTSMHALRGIVQKYKGADEIPGWGAWAQAEGSVPLVGKRWLLSDDERRNQAAIERSIGALIKERYGTAVERNPEFYKELQSQFAGIRNAGDLEALLNDYDEAIDAKRKSLRSGYSRKARDLVDQEGAYHPNELPSSAERVTPDAR